MKSQNNWIKGTLYFVFYLGAMIVILTSCNSHMGSTQDTSLNKVTYPTFTLADTLKGKLSPFRTNFDVSYYALDLDIEMDKKLVSGKVDMYFTAINKIDTLQIDLYKNMSIQSILHGATVLSYDRIHNAVFVNFPKTIQPGSKEKITIQYAGSPHEAKDIPWEGGFIWGKDKSENPWVSVACEYEGASLWWPLKDHRSDKPDSISMRFTVPKGLFCVSSGKLVSHEVEENTETFTWHTSYPTNTDNTALYIGKFTHFEIPYSSKFSSFNMNFYVLDEDVEKAKKRFKQTKDIMLTYEELFGAYPWVKDGFKLIESPHKNLNNQKAIPSIINDNHYKYDPVIVQKTAREWWGNSLSVKDLSDVWIRESFSLYSEALFIEKTDSKNAYLNFFAENTGNLSNKKPLVGPKDVNYWDTSDQHLAMKGASVLHTLRNKIDNDELYFDILKSFYTSNAYTSASTDDFTQLVNKKCDSNFDAFFDQYLYSSVCPNLEWQYLYNKKVKKEYVFYRWKNVDEHFELPILVETSNVTFRISPELNIKVIEIPAGDTIFMNVNESFITLDYNKNMIKNQQ